MKAVDAHPQREMIISSILAGENLTTIAARLSPPISTASLSRYRAAFIAPAIRGMAANSDKTKAIKLLASKSHVDVNAPSATAISAAAEVQGLLGTAGLAANHSGLRDKIVRKLEERDERRNRWFSQAEEAKDFNALASLDGREFRDIEFQARLGGLLADGSAGPETRIRAVVMLPGPQQQPAAAVELEIKH